MSPEWEATAVAGELWPDAQCPHGDLVPRSSHVPMQRVPGLARPKVLPSPACARRGGSRQSLIQQVPPTLTSQLPTITASSCLWAGGSRGWWGWCVMLPSRGPALAPRHPRAALTRPPKSSRSCVASCSRRSQSWPRSSSLLHTIFFCMSARRYWLVTSSSLSDSRTWAGQSCWRWAAPRGLAPSAQGKVEGKGAG